MRNRIGKIADSSAIFSGRSGQLAGPASHRPDRGNSQAIANVWQAVGCGNKAYSASGACHAESGTKGVSQKVKGRHQADPSSITAYEELPLRNNGRRRWRLAFAVLGIGSDAEESKHRSR